MSRLVAVGLSGGIDSAVAAALLKERGERLVGVTMTLGRDDDERALADTGLVAERLGIPLEVVDLSREWRREVVDYLRASYLSGQTPNPCVKCNEKVKLSLLPRFAFERLGVERFATGHYARLEAGRLLRGYDRAKDQSYFLYRVAPDVLSRMEFPLGWLKKDTVRAMAEARGLVLGGRGESQDFCGGDPFAIVGAEDREGEVVTVDGRVVGRHRGFWRYTVGKRKGLGIGGGTPYYVVALDAATNRVVVGFREATVVREFRITSLVNAAACIVSANGGAAGVRVKVRSAGEPRGPVTVEMIDECTALVRVPDGISGVAPGQSAVFYSGDVLLGGGVIAGSLRPSSCGGFEKRLPR